LSENDNLLCANKDLAVNCFLKFFVKICTDCQLPILNFQFTFSQKFVQAAVNSIYEGPVESTSNAG
jgi:hypothetical protein